MTRVGVAGVLASCWPLWGWSRGSDCGPGGARVPLTAPGRPRRQAWDAFVGTPAAFPLAGYVVGGLVALPFLAAGLLPAPVVAAAYLGSVVLVTGVNHADGLADLGDAAVVHGDPETRRDVMRDTTIGVGAVLALGTALLALALAALAVARLPPLVAVRWSSPPR